MNKFRIGSRSGSWHHHRSTWRDGRPCTGGLLFASPGNFALYSTIATYRTLDYFSSNAAFANGGHEYILRQFLVNNSSTFIAFEGRRRGRDQRIGSSTMGIAASPASPTG
jgi:hypothetical protein